MSVQCTWSLLSLYFSTAVSTQNFHENVEPKYSIYQNMQFKKIGKNRYLIPPLIFLGAGKLTKSLTKLCEYFAISKPI